MNAGEPERAERGRARAGGASLLAAERDWRERRRATSSTGALGAHRRTSGENAGENATRRRSRREQTDPVARNRKALGPSDSKRGVGLAGFEPTTF